MIDPTRILVVDDEPMIRSMLERMLGDASRSVTAVASGGEALRAFEAARARGAPFQAVVTDLGMPGMSGLDLARRIKEAEPGTLVVLLTGSSDDDDEPTPDVDLVLHKPGGLHALRGALASPRAPIP